LHPEWRLEALLEDRNAAIRGTGVAGGNEYGEGVDGREGSGRLRGRAKEASVRREVALELVPVDGVMEAPEEPAGGRVDLHERFLRTR
jgi:hypothetical protein